MADTRPIPLVVDLDGTLIRTDMMWESISRLLRRNPFALFQLLFWWMRGRALLKQKLAARVQVDPVTLPYHGEFIAWLRQEKTSGRKLILATASDLKMAKPVADHVALFDEVLASDGKTNLRSENKLRALKQKFGERGFDYAGNSTADYAVWRGSRQAVVVNASPAVLREAANCTTLGPTFCNGFSRLTITASICKELFWRSGYLLAILAGLLLAAAFPGFNLAGFAWIAPALMLFAARGKSGGDAFRTGYVAGLAFWLVSLCWLLRIPVTGFPILGWLALGAYLALYSGVWTWLVSKCGARGSERGTWTSRTLWALSGAAAWVALEMLRARFLTGMPWNLLGVSQFEITPLIQIAAVTGVYGVSFLVAWFSIALFNAAESILRNPARRFAWQAEIVAPLLVTIACYTSGLFWMNQHSTAPEGLSLRQPLLRITLIQPSVPQTMIWSSAADSKRFSSLMEQSQCAATNGAELLIWPESAVPPINEAMFRTITEFAQSNRLWIILNNDDSELRPDATNWFNAACLIPPDGRRWQIYHKRKLVIFGEYVPLARWLPFIRWLTPITGSYKAGKTAAAFNLESLKVKISTLICFEDIFPHTVREHAGDDVDFLVNITNDGWFGEGAAQWQQAAAATFRAVENGLPLIRCANNGVTCWIDRHGRFQEVLKDKNGGIHGSGTLTIDLPLHPTNKAVATTFYNRHGDWFGWSCTGLTLVLLTRKLTIINRTTKK